MGIRPNPIPIGLAQRIRLVIFDVDGVLTDGGIWIGKSISGEAVELKRFDLRDGIGMKMLIWAGLDVAVVSGRVSESTAIRMHELGIGECHQVPDAHKLPVVEEILARTGCDWGEVAMLADDIPDLAVLKRVGLPAAVADATPPVVEVAAWQSFFRGGAGAAREFTNELLLARGQLDGVISRYVRERSARVDPGWETSSAPGVE